MSIDWENPFTANFIRQWQDPEDTDDTYECIARHCNARFREILKEHGVKVIRWEYTRYDAGANNKIHHWNENGAADKDCNTHSAILIDIKPLKEL